MDFEHKKLGKLMVKELTQRDVENFGKEYRALDRKSQVDVNGATVRAAIKAGLITEPEWTVEMVDQMKPYLVAWYAQCIDKAYLEATTVPNE